MVTGKIGTPQTTETVTNTVTPRQRGKVKRLARASEKSARVLAEMAGALTELSHSIGTMAIHMQYAAQEANAGLVEAGLKGGANAEGN